MVIVIEVVCSGRVVLCCAWCVHYDDGSNSDLDGESASAIVTTVVTTVVIAYAMLCTCQAIHSSGDEGDGHLL